MVNEPESIYGANIVISGNCGAEGNEANVTYQLDSDGVLTISGSGAMADYAASGTSAPWYNDRSSIDTIIIEEGITNIGNYAFKNCNNLETIEIPMGVTSIGTYSFDSC